MDITREEFLWILMVLKPDPPYASIPYVFSGHVGVRGFLVGCVGESTVVPETPLIPPPPPPPLSRAHTLTPTIASYRKKT